MAKGDSGVGAPQAPKIDQYSVMHRLMDQMGQSDNAMAPNAGPQQMGGRMSSMPMPRNIFNNGGNEQGGYTGNDNLSLPQSPLAPDGVPDMIRRRMMGMNTYGNQ